MRLLLGSLLLPFAALTASVPQSTAASAQTAAVGRDTSVRADAGAPVVIGTDTLFRLYGNLGPFSAEARAAAVSARLRQVATRLAAGDSIVVNERGSYSELAVRDVIVMTVLDADSPRGDVGHAALAARYSAQLREALVATAQRESVREVLVDVGYAVAATLLLLLLFRLLSFGAARARRRIATIRHTRFTALRIQNFELLSAGRLAALLFGLVRVLRIVLTLLLLYIYVPLVLGFFPWTLSLSHRITGYALRPFAAAWDGFITYLPNLFYLAAGIVIIRYLLALMHLVFGAIGTGAIRIAGFYADWAEPTYKILRVLVFAFAATILYPYLPGANSDAFKGVSIFIGVLFSLGSSAAIGNMVAGVVLTYTRAFQIGDRVQIGETIGDVTEKTLLVTRLRTIKNVAVTIPNGSVLGTQVINYTSLAATSGLILHTTVTIGYDTPWRTVEGLLIEAARKTEHIQREPTPFVLQTSLDDFYVSYQLNAYTAHAELMAATSSQLHRNIQETFNAGGVEIMSPHYAALRNGGESTIPKSAVGS